MNMITGNEYLVGADDLALQFDVSKPWLNRVLEGQPKQYVRAVDGVNFRIRKGETLALVGESGCGKSTVARLMVGLYRPTRGQVCFDGNDLNALDGPALTAARRRFQMIFQDPYASLNPRWRVERIIAEPIRAFGLASDDTAVRNRVGGLLEQVGLTAADGSKFPHEFSGGQRQRISIARTLATEPEFLVCDEPTSALDVSVQAQILNLLKDLQREMGLTYLFISHDLAVVRHMANNIGVMYLGRIVEHAATDDLFARPQHPYTRLLLDAVPDLAMTGRPTPEMGGEVPNPINPPSGCHFHPRCRWVSDRCQSDAPALIPSPALMATEAACHGVQEQRL